MTAFCALMATLDASTSFRALFKALVRTSSLSADRVGWVISAESLDCCPAIIRFPARIIIPSTIDRIQCFLTLSVFLIYFFLRLIDILLCYLRLEVSIRGLSANHVQLIPSLLYLRCTVTTMSPYHHPNHHER